MIKIAIPSYNRYETVSDLTLKLFEKEYFDIHLFVRESQVELYQKHCPGYTVVGVKKNGITPARNAILDYFKKDDEIIMLDDDIKKVTYLKDGKLATMTIEELRKFLYRQFENLKKTPFKMWGVYPISNAFYMSEKYNTKSFIIGTFSGIINTDLRFDEEITLKEDYDFSLQHIFTYGGVLRNNSVACEALHYNNKGGCVDYRDTAREQEAIAILKAKWGSIIRDNPRRPNEILLNIR